MKEIKLTRGQVAIVDDADFEWLNQWKWYADPIGYTFYAKRRDYSLGRPGKTLYMHRQIFDVPKGMDIDHADHNGLNNQRSNIRICTRTQNMVNQRPQKNGSSRYLGVGWDKSRGKWVAQVCKNYKLHYIGRYKTEEEAALAYNVKAKELHGEFANLNVIKE